ncbi:hypothetical protein [Sphingomonas beigongshangi]|uniref:hypothetical protein n=1 Tax=Sphingomonas beigongshangi TaxID=2782540 RepID=UPI00193B0933|nr:hypothetical protein [Sphingomonas beigongshangi]
MVSRLLPGMMFAGSASMMPRPASVIDDQALPNPSAMGMASPDLSGATAQRPGFFSKGGGWVDVLGSIGDQLAGRPIFQTAQRERQQQEAEAQQLGARFLQQQAERLQDHQWHVDDRNADMNKPQFFNSGNDRVRYDPTTGQSQVVYDAPADYESYAASLGLNPGDKGYNEALQDYVLRGSGPTAQRGKIGLEGLRQDNRVQLRGMPTFAQAHPAPAGPTAGPRMPTTMSGVVAPILAKIAQGKTLSPGEQQALTTYQAGRGGRSRGGGGSFGAAVPTVKSPAEARALPPGTRFRTPDGREMVR